jgi:hypothetical protein
MAPKSLKRFRGRLSLRTFFSCVVGWCFCRVFCKFLYAKRGFFVVVRGEVVVICMAERAGIFLTKNTPTFEIYFWGSDGEGEGWKGLNRMGG